MYAVLETGSKQYRVSAGDTLEIERLPVEAGKTFTFDRVLLVNADGKVTVGAPTVTGATVLADVGLYARSGAAAIGWMPPLAEWEIDAIRALFLVGAPLLVYGLIRWVADRHRGDDPIAHDG